MGYIVYANTHTHTEAEGARKRACLVACNVLHYSLRAFLRVPYAKNSRNSV